MVSHTSLTGAAGEHYVLYELLRQGYIAALAPTGAPNVDIVVTDIEGAHLRSIQVKTRRGIGADGGWHMDKKHEEIRAKQLFYCFVDFQASSEVLPEVLPLVYVMPSADVATAIAAAHKKWLGTPGKNGRPHKDSPMRRLLPDYAKTRHDEDNPYGAGWLNKYRDAWRLLKLDPIDPEHPLAEE
ncbi:MAG: hypothetical protein ACLP1U_05910 [Terracidiphilus sp.]